MGLRLEQLSIEFGVDVPVEAFRQFLKDEIACEELDRTLNAIVGLDHLEYSGHFGPVIYFRIRSGDDSPEKREQIIDSIQKVMQRYT